jgi:hypothetical protein
MNKDLQTIFSVRIENLQGFDFEDFVKELFLKRFLENGFLPTRPRKDRGCDGILLQSRTVIACFGPKKYDYNKFVGKVNEDYAEFKRYWQSEYPNWQMVVNHKLDPRQQTYINQKHPGSVLLGLDHLLSLIATGIDSVSRRHIADLLGIPRNQYFSSYLSELLDNLLEGTKTDPEHLAEFNPNRLTGLKEKIQLNYTMDDLEMAEREFELVMPLFTLIESHMTKFDDEEKSKLKLRVVQDYGKMGGDFRQRLESLTNFYFREFASEKDEEGRYNITAVLLYLFEQCLIGKKKEADP